MENQHRCSGTLQPHSNEPATKRFSNDEEAMDDGWQEGLNPRSSTPRANGRR